MIQHKWRAAGRAALVAAVAAGALCLAAQPDGYAADRGDAPPKAASSHLDYVPADAAYVVSFRLADYWDQPAFKAGRDASKAGLPEEAFQDFRRYFGVEPDEVDRMTFVSAANPMINSSYGPSLEPVIVVTTVKPYDRKTILGAGSGVREVKVKDRSYYDTGRGPSYAFLDDRTFVVGLSTFLGPFLSRPEATKDGPMAPVLKLAAEKHLVVAGLNIPTIAKSLPPADKMPLELQPFTPLLKAQFATLTVDLDGEVRADARLTFADEADAREGAFAADDALDFARFGMVLAIQAMHRWVDTPKMTALLRDVQAALRAAKAERKGTTVEVAASLKIDPEAVAAVVTESVPKVREAARRTVASNDLKMLGLAMQNYHDNIGHLPPAAICDKNGKPLLSWRVALLPYIEQLPLYREFHLDEPWDSDHNKPLLAKMPTTFAPPDSEAFKKHETFYQALVGKGSVFEDKDQKLNLAVISSLNGTSNTLLFVEAAKSVPWTKPEDIPFDEGKLVPKLGGLKLVDGLGKPGFLAGFCDGSVRFLPLTVDEKALHCAATYTNATPFTLEP